MNNNYFSLYIILKSSKKLKLDNETDSINDKKWLNWVTIPKLYQKNYILIFGKEKTTIFGGWMASPQGIEPRTSP